MRKVLSLFTIIGIVISIATLSGCKKKQNDEGDGNLRKGKGGRFYGGVFKINESDFIKNMFPHN